MTPLSRYNSLRHHLLSSALRFISCQQPQYQNANSIQVSPPALAKFFGSLFPDVIPRGRTIHADEVKQNPRWMKGSCARYCRKWRSIFCIFMPRRSPIAIGLAGSVFPTCPAATGIEEERKLAVLFSLRHSTRAELSLLHWLPVMFADGHLFAEGAASFCLFCC